MLIVRNFSFTGHRKIEDKDRPAITRGLKVLWNIADGTPTLFHTGGAAGFDTKVLKKMWYHDSALNELHVPFTYQLDALLKELRITRKIFESDSKICSECGPVEYNGNKSLYQKRNVHMVDQLGVNDYLVCYYNEGPSGTKNCIDYALSKPKELRPYIIDIREIESEEDLA
jgi:hypothetical protein